MISPTTFRRIRSARALTTVVFCSALVLIAVITFYPQRPGHAANHKRQQLSFEDRVAAQRALEEVYHQRRLWPKDNPQPKPPLDQVLPDQAIRAKVEDYLRKSAALEAYWRRSITPDELQADLDRMARDTKQPDALRELWAALANDPMMIAECLARPTLVERALRDGYASDERFHGELRRRAEAELRQIDAPARMRAMSGDYREVEWRLDRMRNAEFGMRNVEALDAEQWRAQMDKLRRMFGAERFNPQSAIRNPQWSALQEDEERFYALLILEQSAERVKAAMVEWRKTPFDEWWSGVRVQMEMAAPAGGEYRLSEIAAVAAPCGGDAWTATSTAGAPSERGEHSAVWTGSEMIVWGGYNGSTYINTGGRYNPATDSWTANIATTGAPSGRGKHSAIWTGTEMIIWGGYNGITTAIFNTGGRYNPATNSWTATNTIGVPSARYLHTAIWTGNEMIVWGGGGAPLFGTDTGGRYNPTADSWTATATTGAPSPRGQHTVVWTGSEMIVWGGNNFIGSIFNTGGRYNPATNSWTVTNTTGAPSARYIHTTIWTGAEMIVWGGNTGGQFGDLNTGGRYNPTMDSWAVINTTESPEARSGHTIVWTGNEMIIWGGVRRFDYLNTGGRYNPVVDKWITITTTGTPISRYDHTAVWTGAEMIILGGVAVTDPNSNSNTGGRYSFAPPLTISANTQSFTSTGGAGSVNVTAQGGCTWTAASNANWLTITSGGSGAGNGAVTFSVAANTLGPRTGILTIGTRSFIARQAGVATPRVIRAVTASSAPGNIAVPLEIVSQGDENALGFTLTFDPAVLGNPTVALGADAAGGQLSTNTNQTAQGRLGIALALAAGQKFAAGTRQFAVVTFTTPASLASGMTQIDFDDLPSAREVSDVNANALPASYQGGSISIVSGFEADVAPRPQGNGSVTITDWVQLGRFAAGLDTAAAGVEFQRADCAPRDTKGNGALTVADWTQAGRYATGADAIAAAGGPTVQASQSSVVGGRWLVVGGRSTTTSRQASLVSARWQPVANHQPPTTNHQAPTTNHQAPTTNHQAPATLTIEMDARGDENALGFSLQFDPSEWSFVSAATGRDAAGATLHVNATQAARGRIGVVLALPAGQRLEAGARQVVIVRLAARGGRGAIEFSDYPVKREVVDAEANVTPSAFAAEGAESTAKTPRSPRTRRRL
jgi:N-acetylneuraminic acid mutarotase